MLKKINAFLLILFTIFITYSFCSENYINIYSNENNPPKVENLIPKKGEQYIISKPEIKIYFSNINEKTMDNIKLYINYDNVTNKIIKTSEYIYYKPEKKLKRGIHVAKLEYYDSFQDKKIDLLEWYFYVGSPVYNHFRGMFFDNAVNSSSMISNYDDINSISRYTNKLDYVFITEKINNNHNIVETYLKSRKWKKLIESCDKYTASEEFLSIPGFELSLKLKDKTDYTNLNLYNWDQPFAYKNNLTLDTVYKQLFNDENNLIGQFKYSDTFNNVNFFKYSPYGDKIITLFELKKVINHDKSELSINSYIEALNNGWHLAPIFSEYIDTFDIKSSSNFSTVVLCEELSKNNLLDALRNRRVYASEDKNIKVDFFINKSPMGSIIDKPKMLKFNISAIDNDDDDKINKIEVFSNDNNLLETKEFNSNYAKLDFTLENVKINTFYYVVITQNNNKKTVTAPIWIE